MVAERKKESVVQFIRKGERIKPVNCPREPQFEKFYRFACVKLTEDQFPSINQLFESIDWVPSDYNRAIRFIPSSSPVVRPDVTGATLDLVQYFNSEDLEDDHNHLAFQLTNQNRKLSIER